MRLYVAREDVLAGATGPGQQSMALDQVSAIKTLASGAHIPHASKTVKTDTKVGNYYLTCDDQGQKMTGKVVFTETAVRS